MITTCSRPRQHGTSMIEVLVTVVIVAFGLLGLAALQARMQLSDMESYQRAQALVLLNDMSSRIATNRDKAATYVTASALAGNAVCPTSATTLEQVDTLQWCNALQGAAEITGGNKAGAMLGARGCIANIAPNEYMVTVAWQGMTPTARPAATVTCGAGLYDGAAGTPCQTDLCRRTVTTVINIATLT